MRVLNKDINLFVSCNKETFIPNIKYLIPIHTGKAISNLNLDFQGDNTGDNISILNKYFCELTTQYWAWKNVECEYYGFMHYRRFFSFSKPILNKDYIQSDLFFESINPKSLELIGYKENIIKSKISNYDVILPIPMNLFRLDDSTNTIYKHYKESPQHDIRDLDYCRDIILREYPYFKKYIDKGFNLNYCSFLNMFIMKKEYFKEYSEWLFKILLQFHKNKNYNDASYYSIRTPGLLGERLLNIFILYLIDTKKNLKIGYFQNTFFEDTSNPFLEPLNNNKNAICFASDDVYIKHLSVALISIAENTKSELEIIILDNHINYPFKTRLISQMDKYKNIHIRFLKIGDYLRDNLYEKNHIKKSAYARFVILDLLKKYNNILYLDSDLILNDDVSNLLNTPLNDNYAGVVLDSSMGSWVRQFQKYGQDQREYNINVLKLKNPSRYFNSGVMLLNVSNIIKDNISTDYLFKIALKKEWMWQDQDILNKVLKNKLLFLDRKWNYMTHEILRDASSLEYNLPINEFNDYKKAQLNPSIIHFAGHNEPIYNVNVLYADKYWKYAVNSYFYYDILKEMCSLNVNYNYTKHGKIYYIVVKLFPRKGWFYRILRSIYHFFIG